MVRKVELPEFVSHGTLDAYMHYDCLCESCRDAYSRHWREQRARTPQADTERAQHGA